MLRYRSAPAAVALAAIAAVLFVPVAEATNGYFTHGYGTTNKGLAGAGVAFPQDSLIIATNPAGIAFLGKRYDAGLALFNPNRQYTVNGNPSQFPGTFGLVPGTVESDSEYFVIPHFGLTKEINSSSSWGFALYGHGGMNTDYPTATFHTTSPTGVDLSQLLVVPTYAFKLGGGDHAVGISAILAYQMFEIQGALAFGQFSSNPAALSNNGKDDGLGFGFKVGYLGKFSPTFSLGASYQSKVSMDEFGDYAGLFAEQGGFDIPPSWTVGIAIHASDKVTFVFDLQETMYSDVNSIGNPLFPNLGIAFMGDPSYLLGGDNGPGFGWEDMTTYKAGIQIAGNNGWTWRFGASSGDQPIPESEMMFNILAPGVMEEHFTLGFTKDLQSGRKINFALMHAPSVTVSGPNMLEAPGQQTIDLEMDQWEAEISFSWGF